MTGPFDLHGQTAVVSGARRGIGRAMTLALANAGADIIAVSATMDESDTVVDEVRNLGRVCDVHQIDFADREAVIALGSEIAAAAPNILVNNAGTIERARAAEHPLDLWDRVMDVNLSNQFVFTQGLARPMLERGSGRIIFTA